MYGFGNGLETESQIIFFKELYPHRHFGEFKAGVKSVRLNVGGGKLLRRKMGEKNLNSVWVGYGVADFGPA